MELLLRSWLPKVHRDACLIGCETRWKFPRASHPTIAQSIAHRILPSRIASYHRAKHRASHPTIAHRILPSRIASYHRAKHRASHPTIAHRNLPSHDFSRLHSTCMVLLGHHKTSAIRRLIKGLMKGESV